MVKESIGSQGYKPGCWLSCLGEGNPQPGKEKYESKKDGDQYFLPGTWVQKEGNQNQSRNKKIGNAMAPQHAAY